MRGLFLIALTLIGIHWGSSLGNELETQERGKRNAHQLCTLIFRYTSRGCLAYSAYGCFCGLRSWGSDPVDGSDSCCKQHDRCFGNLGVRNVPLVTYSYDCNGPASCYCTNEDRSSVKYKSCLCDIELASCLKRNKDSYNRRYFWYRRSNCE
ncbi:basic phospholipase A2 caudoxin [Biomphalaria pfeifferi]|uniref:Basic phospholipase A2 caudoxin n=1 Tax=Biomphalaria pfeifferi TaxID=112525 RepID=A0AAD8F146_BIOPF|nr:basic phospholipase A2 caudoxin [Biomphalaria pfeifferi]